MARQSVLGEMRQSVSSRTVLCALIIILALSTVGCAAQQENTTEAKWISLFNGKDLTGWTPKFAGSDLGRELQGHLPRPGRIAHGLLRELRQVQQRIRAPVLQGLVLALPVILTHI